jgi:RNA polymerase sigma factor for flagellar operon FliA
VARLERFSRFSQQSRPYRPETPLLSTSLPSSTTAISVDCFPLPESLPSAVEVDGPTLLSAHLTTVQEAIRVVCRLQNLSADDAEELSSLVYLKLLQGNGAVLRRFRGDSSLRTFLIVVVKRVLLDCWIARNGKWRPSTDARRLGEVAMELERLVYREGMSLAEAAETVRISRGVTDTDDELAFMLSLLPARPTRRFVSDATLAAVATADADPLERLINHSGPSRMAQVKAALGSLSPDDRLLLSLRFAHNLTVREIALRRGLDPKALYRRFERMLRQLRGHIGAQPRHS